MKVAINLFSDKRLIEIILKQQIFKGNCEISYQTNIDVFDINDSAIIANYLATIINLYSISENDEATKTKKLYELIKSDWAIFSNKANKETVYKLLKSIFEVNKGIINVDDLSKSAFISDVDGSIRNKYSIIKCGWPKFADRIKTVNRFHSNEFNSEMFDKFLETIIVPIESGHFYRGRICGAVIISDKDMLAPPSSCAKSSRASPKYISTLYLCNDISIVPNECRASCNDYMTISEFELSNGFSVFDLRLIKDISPFDYPSEELFIYYNLKTINQIASELEKPMTSVDIDIEYIPVQYLCEYMRFYAETHPRKNIIGITYHSVMTRSKKVFNLAAFSGSYFKLIGSRLFRIEDYKPSLNEVKKA